MISLPGIGSSEDILVIGFPCPPDKALIKMNPVSSSLVNAARITPSTSEDVDVGPNLSGPKKSCLFRLYYIPDTIDNIFGIWQYLLT